MSGFRCGLVASFTDQHAFFPRVQFLGREFIMKKREMCVTLGFQLGEQCQIMQWRPLHAA